VNKGVIVLAPVTEIRLWLWFSLLYNIVEAMAALWVGHQAHSIALWGFGLDSVIEVAATGVVLWHMLRQPALAPQPCVHNDHETPHHHHANDHHNHPHGPNLHANDPPRWIHQFIALTFWLLALYIALEAVMGLIAHETPQSSWGGLVIGGLSVIIMPLLAWRKLQLSQQLGNTTDAGLITAEAKETLACGMLSLTMLMGLGLNYAFGWWWADGVTALCMTFWLIKEGQHCWQEGICAH
jgi:divalent metal cation (Fe/Co/Zn/Cd) transporter